MSKSINNDMLQKTVNSLRWFHSIDLGGGIITPGEKGGPHETPEDGLAWMQNEQNSLQLPDLKDKTVLDVGCRDGFYGFEAERQGANVELLDTWGNSDWGTVRNVELARNALGSKAIIRHFSLYDLEHGEVTYDVVLALGLIYHLRCPIYALTLLYSFTCELLVVESHFIEGDEPTWKFLPGNELNNDRSCWWSPTVSAIIEVLKVVGFEKVEEVHRWADRVVIHAGW